jgi:hypothetical protein
MLKENNYSVLSGVELMMTVFPEQEFCVQDVVPKGLVILTGEDLEPVRTMAMDMCLRVVKGERLWHMDARQGAVLYMIHRYNLAATRNLILDMSDRVPDELHIGVMPESSLELAVSGIQSFVEAHANASLVVLELCGIVEQCGNAVYVPVGMLRKYKDLQKLAHSHGIGVVVLLRTRIVPAVQGGNEPGDLVCLTEQADGHIDICVTDPKERRAVLRVDNPARGTQLRSVVYDPGQHRWMEENGF